MSKAYVAVGSNINPEKNIQSAVCLLSREVHITGISTVYRTKAVSSKVQPPFLNCVLEIETDIPPVELKNKVLQRVECDLGRVRSEDKYAPRSIDLDLIMYDNLTMASDNLIIPDPEIRYRSFLVIPLYELAPDLTVPGQGYLKTLAAEHRNHNMVALRSFTDKIRRSLIYGCK